LSLSFVNLNCFYLNLWSQILGSIIQSGKYHELVNDAITMDIAGQNNNKGDKQSIYAFVEDKIIGGDYFGVNSI